jgi:hypothetical protein
MKEKKLITEYFDGVIRKGKSKNDFSHSGSLAKSGLKLFSASIFTFLLLLSISSVGGTVSYFNDTEGTLNNYLRADPVSFKVETAANQVDLSEEKIIDLVMLPDDISDPIQYFVSGKYISGDKEFCSGINVLGTSPFQVNSKIDSLVTDVSTTTGLWTITVNVPDDLKIPNKSCEVELTYLGWNAGSLLGKSFTDTRKVNLLFFIPGTYQASSKVGGNSESLVVPTTTENSQGDEVTQESVEISGEEVVPTPTPTPTPEVEEVVEVIPIPTPTESTAQQVVEVTVETPSQTEAQ